MSDLPLQASWRVKEPTRNPSTPSLDGLLEEGSEAIPVRITIVQDDVTTGWDDGALGFEEDAVWFSGRATSFRLAAPDVLPGAYLLSRREAVTAGEALNQGFPLRHPTREVWVRVEVLTVKKEDRTEHETRLVAGVQRIRACTQFLEMSEYPPLTLRPGMVRSKGAWNRTAAWLGALSILFLAASFVLVVFCQRVAISMSMLIPVVLMTLALSFLTQEDKVERFVDEETPRSPQEDA